MFKKIIGQITSKECLIKDEYFIILLAMNIL